MAPLALFAFASKQQPKTSNQKKGSPKAPSIIARLAWLATSRHRCLSARRALHLARIQTACADLHLFDLPVDDSANTLQARVPRATRLVVRVRDVVAERDALVADETAISTNSHGS